MRSTATVSDILSFSPASRTKGYGGRFTQVLQLERRALGDQHPQTAVPCVSPFQPLQGPVSPVFEVLGSRLVGMWAAEVVFTVIQCVPGSVDGDVGCLG